MNLPTILETHYQHIQTRLNQQIDDFQTQYQRLNTEQQNQFKKVLAVSHYVLEELAKDWAFIFNAIHTNRITQPIDNHLLNLWLDEFLPENATEADLQRSLRQLRRRAMLCIIWTDTLKLKPMLETTKALSNLADVCVNRGIKELNRLLEPRFGNPIGKHSQSVQPFMVLGMGKLGAYELNLSSDIDLIFIYPESGQTDGKKCLSNQEYFTRLGQKLIQALDAITEDGFVFRTDMRLRPYGQSGPLVMNFASFEEYYQEQGRDWERYAMVKARILTGEQTAQGKQLLSILKPFIYRHYVDFGAIDALRKMKAMIRSEVRRRGLENNVKLGAGGIREIEFIVQAFQLIRGGQDPQLQKRELIKVLDVLSGEGHLPPEVCQELKQAYVFLRNSEHAIQALNDEQTQTLPENELNQAQIAHAMQFDCFNSYLKELNQQRTKVSHHFAQIVASDEEDQENNNLLWQNLWQGNMSEQTKHTFLQQHPHPQTEEIIQTLAQFREHKAVQNMQPIGRERLDALMPLLLLELWQQDNALQGLTRILPLLEAVIRRTAYLVLLKENPQALKQLVKLFLASTWVAKYIIDTPILLDELLTPANLYKLPDKTELAEELRLRLLRVEEQDEEQQIEQLSQFVRARKLYASACEVMGILTVMQTSDYLTYLSEVMLESVLQLSWQQMTKKYGFPQNQQKQAVLEPEFIIIGYGKIGGIEMSYSSDLDLVFLHNAYTQGETDGKRSINNQVFYTRLGQRIIHIMTTQTRTGQLYEIDMRLRPAGNSGLIATSIQAFEKYQQEQAWTWEHQALIRARCICGDNALKHQFAQIRTQILTQPRDLVTLKQEVKDMRQKMREHLGSKPSDKGTTFHLKQDFGGIVDIEFLVQYSVLAWSSSVPQLLEFTDNMRQLDAIANAGLINPKDCQMLQDTYLTYRGETHRRALQETSLLMDNSQVQQLGFHTKQAQVINLWHRLLD